MCYLIVTEQKYFVIYASYLNRVINTINLLVEHEQSFCNLWASSQYTVSTYIVLLYCLTKESSSQKESIMSVRVDLS